jgi:hypothetical protein
VENLLEKGLLEDRGRDGRISLRAKWVVKMRDGWKWLRIVYYGRL